jgi:hypothetical protein
MKPPNIPFVVSDTLTFDTCSVLPLVSAAACIVPALRLIPHLSQWSGISPCSIQSHPEKLR